MTSNSEDDVNAKLREERAEFDRYIEEVYRILDEPIPGIDEKPTEAKPKKKRAKRKP